MNKHRFLKRGTCSRCSCSSFVIEKFDPGCPSMANVERLADRWCSICMQKSIHRLLEWNLASRNDYVCQNCGNHTVECRAPGCDSMARGYQPAPKEESWLKSLVPSTPDQFCAVHNGSICSFEKLASKIHDISEHPELAKRDALNYSTIGKVIVGTAAGAAVLIPGAIAAAPAFASALGATGVLGAAATGTTISTLSGAALTSASLASLGGSMAAGLTVITVTGSALGGTMGGMVATAYAREVKNYEVKRINYGAKSGPAVVCIDGFLTEGNVQLAAEWSAGLSEVFPNNPWYHLRWESKCLQDLGSILAVGGRGAGLSQLAKLAQRAMKKPAKGLGLPLAVLGLADNPWHVAMTKSMMTGALVADMLCRTLQRRPFILIGHSLGARVIFYALQNLASRAGAPRVEHAILLGGAVGGTKEEWEACSRSVSGRIINCHSSNDDVLRCLYKAGTAFTSAPVGRNPIPFHSTKIHNKDVSAHVGGHIQYKPQLRKVLHEIMPLLDQ